MSIDKITQEEFYDKIVEKYSSSGFQSLDGFIRRIPLDVLYKIAWGDECIIGFNEDEFEEDIEDETKRLP